MDASPFARLSSELRNIIYEYTFTTPYAITLRPNTIQHPLTRTCRQLRYETLPMFYSLARFNAHLEDGPITPLINWLQVIGPEACLLLRELNIWDLHMLNATLHGTAATKQLVLGAVPDGCGPNARYILDLIRSDACVRGWWIEDVVRVLTGMGLGLARICVEGKGQSKLKLTSSFSVVEDQPAYGDEKTSTPLHDVHGLRTCCYGV